MGFVTTCALSVVTSSVKWNAWWAVQEGDIFYVIVNSSLLLLGHTSLKSESRLRSWQRSWPCWNQWLFYPGIQWDQAFISVIFPWTCLFLCSCSKVQRFYFYFFFFFCLCSSKKALKAYSFFEQCTIDLLLSMRKHGEISLHCQADKVVLWLVSIVTFFHVLLLSS